MMVMFSFRSSKLKVVTETGPAKHCPFCKDGFAAGEDDSVECPSCGAASHLNCWEQNRGCAVFGCRGHAWIFTRGRLAAEMTGAYSLKNLASETSAWCATILGLAFLIFLPMTMASMLALPADNFREWILTPGYLAGSLSLASGLVAAALRGGLRDRNECAGFVIAFLLLMLGIWCAGDIWTRAHLPY